MKTDDLTQRVDKIGPAPKLTGSINNIKKILPLKNREAAESFEKQLDNATVLNEFVSINNSIN